MQFSRNNLPMTDHFFLRITQNFGFLIYLFKLALSPYLVSQVITATMLFLQFMLYSSSFFGTLKNEIPEAVLELCQLKIKQLSPDILKFRRKHEDSPFTLHCSVVLRSFLFVFHAGLRGLGSNNTWNSSCKEKSAGSARFFRLFFRFLHDYGVWCIFRFIFKFAFPLTCSPNLFSRLSFKLWLFLLLNMQNNEHNYEGSEREERKWQKIIQEQKRSCW